MLEKKEVFNKMFTVYTFMMDNERKRLEEVKKEEEERNTDSRQEREVNQSWNEGQKIQEIQSNNVMAEHHRNVGEGGATKSR